MWEYEIKRLDMSMPDLYGMNFDPEMDDYCENAEFAPIESYVWDVSGYRPEARAYVTYDDEGLHVLLCACESTIEVNAKEFNGEVYKDSCLEFFLQPFEDDPRYINIETNAAGVALIGLGPDRFERKLMAEQPECMNITASRHRGGWWAVSYDLPFELIEDIFGRRPQPGDVMRGNFYKCDESVHPHFGSWAPILNVYPDFHLPKFFGRLKIC